jgi:hypothetical protein
VFLSIIDLPRGKITIRTPTTNSLLIIYGDKKYVPGESLPAEVEKWKEELIKLYERVDQEFFAAAAKTIAEKLTNK